MADRKLTGITRRVAFVGWCKRAGCDWHGPERTVKSDAAFDVAAHGVDAHGGSWLGDHPAEEGAV